MIVTDGGCSSVVSSPALGVGGAAVVGSVGEPVVATGGGVVGD